MKIRESIFEYDFSDLHFESRLDQDYFFEWLRGLGIIDSYKGGVIRITERDIGEMELRDLIALFYRYNLDMQCLAAFRSPENSRWFEDRSAYWYSKVFNGEGRLYLPRGN